MNGDRWVRMQQLFEEALRLPPGKRTAFVQQACGNDAELRAELESLLEHDSRAGEDFLLPPERSREAIRQALEHVRLETADEAVEGPDPLIGQRIGRYHIKARIAAGGMAVVYEAVQQRPHRVVALKVMKPQIAARSAVRRFEFEAQVLARLRHPNIAQVFEAGTHELGGARVLFFAMEYIPGARDIIEYATRKGLGIRERLELFLGVCDAVHHGHARGVIHRDLKPSNILIDASGRPKVIDFGVARATDSDLALTTQQTHIGQLVGTIQYMSPEQCDADPHEIDTRSDVYSLGVVLYELLSGTLPYDATGSTIYRAAKVIQEREPRRLGSVKPRLAGDLETIVHKALEKDRERRYASAAELAADIRRYLAGEPITARPPSAWYVLRKFAGRHRAAFVASLLVLLTLVGAVAVSSVFALVARRQRNAALLAERDARRAERQARQSENVARRERRRARFRAYTSRLSAAQGAWADDDPATARRMLELADKDLRGWEWRHLMSRMDQSLGVVAEVPVRFRDLAIDPTARRCAVLAWDEGRPGEITVVDLRSGTLSSRFVLRGIQSVRIGWSRDGRRLAAAGPVGPDVRRSVIMLWDATALPAEKLIARWQVGHCDGDGFAFHPSLAVLAVGFGDGTVGLWDLRDTGRLATDGGDVVPPDIVLAGPTRNVWCLAYSPDGCWLAAGTADNLIYVWDVERALAERGVRQPVIVFAGHDDHVRGLDFSPDARLLASGSVDGTIRLWDFAAAAAAAQVPGADRPISPGRTLGVLTGHSAPVHDVVFDPGGQRLISCGADRTIRVWDVRADAPVSDARGRHFYRVARRRLINTLRGHARPVRRLRVLPDGRIVSGGEDGTVRLWAQDAEDIPRLREHFSSVFSVAFTPDGRYVLSGGGANDDCLAVWDPRTCTPVSRTYLRNGETISGIVCWRSRLEATWLAAVTHSGRERDREGRLLIWRLDAQGQPGRPVFARDHRGPTPTSGELYRGYCTLTVSRDGSRLATADMTGAIEVWDVSDPAEPRRLARMQADREETWALAFLDTGGRWLVSGQGSWLGKPASGKACPLRLWDVDNQTLVAAYGAHTDSIIDAAVSPSGDLLATASCDQTVRLWSIDRSAGRLTIRPLEVLHGHADYVYAVAFHPTERRLASGARDGTIKVWDYAAGAEVATLRGQKGAVKRLAFSPDGRILASASGGQQGADNVVWLWEAPDQAAGDAGPSADGSGAQLGAIRYRRAVAYRARNAVWELFQTPVPSLAEARDRLADPRQTPLPDQVRSFALEHFELLLPHPRWFYLRAEPVVGVPGLSREAYEKALIWARQAADMALENALYRDAVEDLAERAGQRP